MQSNTNMATGSAGIAYLALTTAALCWGANIIFGKMAVGELSPMMLVFARWAGATLLLVVFANHFIRQDWPILKNHLRYITIMGTFGFTFFTFLLYSAAHGTSGLNIGILQGAIPIFVLLGVFVIYNNRITPIQLLGVLITLAGVVTTVSQGDLSTLSSLKIGWGDGLMLLACLFYAGYAIGLRSKPKTSSLGFFACLTLVATIASIPLLGAEIALGDFQWPTAKGWLVVLGVTLLPSFTAQLCFMKGVEIIGPARAGVFANLVPIFGSVLVVIFLGEKFQAYHALAIIMVLGGIALSELGKAKNA